MHKVTKVGTPEGNVVEVSTIDPDGSLVRWPETCIFRTWIEVGSGQSEVVATYTSSEEAFKDHDVIVEKVRKGEIR